MKYLQFLSLIFICMACNSPAEEKQDNGRQEETPADSLSILHSTHNPENSLFVWKVDYDYTKKRNPAIDKKNLTVDSLVKGLNAKYENVLLEVTRQSNDTLYTIIKESGFLTQQMGSSGAELYLADAVLNLTEVPGVRYVNIALQGGDHMQPGTWSSENFSKYKTLK
jgi:hypothetical protein